VSWVAIDDVVRAIEHALASDSLSGPVNVTAPEPVTNADYARTLGRVLRRPAVLPAPAAAMRLVLGEFAGEILGGQRVVADRLTESGFEFQHPQLEGALRHVLGRPG
jgi:NAD dependent epimerase/dehydratase family enzyme